MDEMNYMNHNNENRHLPSDELPNDFERRSVTENNIYSANDSSEQKTVSLSKPPSEQPSYQYGYARPPVQQPQRQYPMYGQQGFPQGRPEYYSGGASVAGYAPAYPMYTYQKTPKEIERDKIREAANAGGKLTIAIFITMFVVATIIVLVGFFSGIVRDMPSTDDPYMNFTPMGFYLYEGLVSLASIFIPSVIIMSSLCKKNNQKIDDFLPFSPIKGKKLAVLVFGGMSLCMAAQLMAILVSVNFSVFGFDINEAIDVEYGTTIFDVIMNSICTAFIPALAEEFAYRGVVLGALKKYDVNLAIIGSAFLFGMMHGNLAQIPFAFVIGLVLAYVRVKSNSMLPNILIHFGNNFYAVILSTLEEVLPDDVSTLIDSAVMVAFILIGLICIYYLTKSEKNFFQLESRKTYLTFGEKLKAFFTAGTVIVGTIILCIETVAMVRLI